MAQKLLSTNLTIQEQNFLLNSMESYFNHLLSIQSLNINEEIIIANQIQPFIKGIPLSIIKNFINKSQFYIMNYLLIREYPDIDDIINQSFFKLFDYKDLTDIAEIIFVDFISMLKKSKVSTNDVIQFLRSCNKHDELHPLPIESLKLTFYIIKFHSLQICEINTYLVHFFTIFDKEYHISINNDMFIFILKQFIMNYCIMIYDMNDDNNSIKHTIFDYVYKYTKTNNYMLFKHFTESIEFYMHILPDELNSYFVLKEL